MTETKSPQNKYATPEYLRGIPNLKERLAGVIKPGLNPTIAPETTQAIEAVKRGVMTVLRLSPGPDTGKENRVLIEPSDDSGMNWHISTNIVKPGCDVTTEMVLVEGVSAEDLSPIFYGKEDNGEIWKNQSEPKWTKNGERIEGEENGATFEVT